MGRKPYERFMGCRWKAKSPHPVQNAKLSDALMDTQALNLQLTDTDRLPPLD